MRQAAGSAGNRLEKQVCEIIYGDTQNTAGLNEFAWALGCCEADAPRGVGLLQV